MQNNEDLIQTCNTNYLICTGTKNSKTVITPKEVRSDVQRLNKTKSSIEADSHNSTVITIY